jgi:hypothetical protein
LIRDEKSNDAASEKIEAEAAPVEARRTRLEKCMLVVYD